jgi:hypothetical protein
MNAWANALIAVENQNPTETIDKSVRDLGVKCAGISGRSILFVPLSEGTVLPADILDKIEDRLKNDRDVRRLLNEMPKLDTIQLVGSS